MILDRKIAPKFNAINHVSIEKHENLVETNDFKIIGFKRETIDLLKIDFIFQTGKFKDTKPCISAATINLLFSGTPTLSSKNILEQLDGYGAYIQKNSGIYTSVISLFCLKKYANQCINIIFESIKECVFPENEIEIYKEIKKQTLSVNHEKTTYLANKAFNKMVFGNTVLGTSVELADYDAINQSDLIYFQKNQLFIRGLLCIITGNYTTDNCKCIEKNLAGIDWKPTINNKEITLIQNPTTRDFIEKQSVQSSIVKGFITVNRNHKDIYGIMLCNLLLGGYFGSRLMKNIRETKGLTYGIHSRYQSFKNIGLISIHSDANQTNISLVDNEIEFEINNLLNPESYKKDEFITAKNYLIGSFQRGFDGPFTMSEKYYFLQENDLNYDYLENYITNLNSIDFTSMLQTMNNYFKNNTLYTVIAGSK